MRLLMYLFIVLVLMTGCGKHESTNSGFINSGQSFQGKEQTAEEKLLSAIDTNDLTYFNEHVEKGFVVDAILSNGRTLLIHATVLNRPLFVWKLLNKGADIAKLDAAGKSALDYAQDNISILNLIDPEKQKAAQEALFVAVTEEDAGTVQVLLDNKVLPNFIHSSGETPLTQAVQLKLFPIVKTLSRWKDKDGINTIDLNFLNQSGLSAVQIAKEKSFKKILDELIKNGAKLDESGS